MGVGFNLKKASVVALGVAALSAMTASAGASHAALKPAVVETSTTAATTVPPTSVEETTTTTVVEISTPPSTTATSTTTTVPKRAIDISQYDCPEWYDTAISVGWDPAQWPRLSQIIFRESRCHPESWNQQDPTENGSRGLTQINGVWCMKNENNPVGWLQARGILTECVDLHNPIISLRASLAIWEHSGWGPWGFSN